MNTPAKPSIQTTHRRHLKWILPMLLAFHGPHSFAAVDIDDLMSITWEGFWSQNGSPSALWRWNQPLKVRLIGMVDSLHRKSVEESLKEITDAAGLEFSILAADDPNENVLIELVNDSPKLGGNMVCITSLPKITGDGIQRVEITAHRNHAQNCMLHEFGHMIGIFGHPYGETVMTYFNPRNRLSDYDKLIIKARYSPEIRNGQTPFRVLRRVGERYIGSLPVGDERENARQHVNDFMKTIRERMEKYALADGEPPTVIFRSGLISMSSVNNGRVPMQFYLGEAILAGDMDIRQAEKGEALLKKAAASKNLAAILTLAWRHQTGHGLPKPDSSLSYAWYAYAARLGNPAAQKQQKKIEESTPEAQMLAYRDAAQALQDSLGEIPSAP